MINKAILYKKEFGKAYGMKGNCLVKKGKLEEAKQTYQIADKYVKKNLEDWDYYFSYFWRYSIMNDYYESLYSFYLFKDSKPLAQIITPNQYHRVFELYMNEGFPEVAERYAKIILELENDSILYFKRLRNIDISTSNYNSSIKYHLKSNDQYPNEWDSFNLSRYYYCSRDDKNGAKYLAQMHNLIQEKDIQEPLPWIVNNPYLNEERGFIENKYGNKERAKLYFNKTIERCQKEIELNRPEARRFDSHFTLACVYASLGEKEKAMKYLLEIRNRRIQTAVQYNELKNHPALDILRNEPEYKELLKEVESKYLELHNQVGKLIKRYEKG